MKIALPPRQARASSPGRVIATRLARLRHWAAGTFLRPALIVLHDSRTDGPHGRCSPP
jgi:hypothetical protein